METELAKSRVSVQLGWREGKERKSVGLNWTGNSHWQRQSKQRSDKQTDAYSQRKNCHSPMLCWHIT
ncbi:type IV secretory system conjugative DNA transfer family protein [Sesbania bispinosa]|nr:type IV secretory system conjugative DNA transfer family protein [Sesbania bispinosa]